MTSPLSKHVKRLHQLTEKSGAPLPVHLFAYAALEHMKRYGTRPHHLAKIAYKNHNHGRNNPYSQSQKAYTLEEILNSGTICGPLTKLQCCTTTDGAAAVILASEEFVLQHGLERQAVDILGMEMATDLPSIFTDNSVITLIGYGMSQEAARRVFSKVKYNPTDVDVVELHDCFSINELILYEALGLCPPGKGGELVARGVNTYGGKYVINPSGGLIGKGHPIGATGIAQCIELCWQLRGEAGKRQIEGAKLALQHNYGWGGAAIVGLYTTGFPAHQHNAPNMGVVQSDFKVTPYFKILKQLMRINEEQFVEKLRGIMAIQVRNSVGHELYWIINTKIGKGTIKFQSSKIDADVTLTVTDEDLVELLLGRINFKEIHSQGRLKIDGDVTKLTILQKMLSQDLNIKSKI